MTIPSHNPKLVVPTGGVENKSWTNGHRAESAKEIIEYYRQTRRMDPDEETLFIDLITDVLHFLHSKKIDGSLFLEKANRRSIAGV